LPTFPHTAAAIYQEAHRHRGVLTGEEFDPLRCPVLEDSKSLFGESPHVGTLPVLDRDVRNNQFSA